MRLSLITDKNLQYRADYNNRPSNTIFFMSDIARTSVHLHCEFVSFICAGSLGN